MAQSRQSSKMKYLLVIASCLSSSLQVCNHRLAKKLKNKRQTFLIFRIQNQRPSHSFHLVHSALVLVSEFPDHSSLLDLLLPPLSNSRSPVSISQSSDRSDLKQWFLILTLLSDSPRHLWTHLHSVWYSGCQPNILRSDHSYQVTDQSETSITSWLTNHRAAGLVERLSGPDPVTVFAPTNAAFDILPPGKMQELLSNPAVLEATLFRHMTAGRFCLIN